MTSLQQSAARYFDEQLGVSLDAVLAPIDGASPTGKSIREDGVCSAIEKARRQDDASLPMGTWEYDLKRADWPRVTSLTLDALQHKSKDMQLVAWLLEAQIHQRGFTGIAPCMVLAQQLCERYWEQLHPQAEDGDLEYRANIVRWMSEKLLTALRLVPITRSSREDEYCWADLEQAHRNEQIKSSGGNSVEPLEGATMGGFIQAVGGTSTEVYKNLSRILGEALQSIDELGQMLDSKFGDQAPGLGSMADLLHQVQMFAESELHKRGVRPAAMEQPQAPAHEADAAAADDLHAAFPDAGQPERGPIRDRADAYARLSETADFLMRLEPHSPVPYLVRRATEWGHLNTVELYQELFLKLNGQLNIFEMLGLHIAENNSN